MRPNNQRARGKRKRQNDPARHAYKDLLDKSGADGGHILDAGTRSSITLEGTSSALASGEPSAIPKSINKLKTDSESRGSPLAQVQTATSDVTSPGSELGEARVMMSPTEQILESPDLSSGDDEESDEDPEGLSAPSSPETIREHSRGVQLPLDTIPAADHLEHHSTAPT